MLLLESKARPYVVLTYFKRIYGTKSQNLAKLVQYRATESRPTFGQVAWNEAKIVLPPVVALYLTGQLEQS